MTGPISIDVRHRLRGSFAVGVAFDFDANKPAPAMEAQGSEKAEPQAEVIRVQVREVAQLFNSLDPSPFHERDLDQDAEEYIVDYARELRADRPFRLVVQLPVEQAMLARAHGLETAFGNFFRYRARRIELQLRDLFRGGRRHLAVGLPLLVACLLASQSVARLLDPSPWAKVVEESLIILGWVANWRPIEIFLYDWWPLRRDLLLYRRLMTARVVIEVGEASPAPLA